MVIHQSRGLHMGVTDGGTYKLESALFQVFAECV